MKSTKTFKSGTPLSDLIHFAMVEPAKLGGTENADRATRIVETLRVTIEMVRGREFDAGPVLADLGLDAAAADVDEYLEYRRDDLRKAVRSVKSLRRLLKPFEGKPGHLTRAISNSMAQGWTGLFMDDRPGRDVSRAIDRKGGSNGGKW